jgi:hypothetical protein
VVGAEGEVDLKGIDPDDQATRGARHLHTRVGRRRQLTAFFTSALILTSSAGVNSFSA